MGLITDEAREWATRPFPTFEFVVGRNDIARYARAIGATEPVHFDIDAARVAGHPDLLAPPFFPYIVRMHATNLVDRVDLEADGSASRTVPPLDTDRAMAGETHVEFGGPVHAGDTLTLETRIVDLYEKEGASGPLVFVKTESTVHNQRAERVYREWYTRIYR